MRNERSAYKRGATGNSARATRGRGLFQFHGGQGFHSMGLNLARFMLPDLALPEWVRSIAPPVIRPSRWAAQFFDLGVGMNAIKTRREMYNAKSAISCLHDALLAVAKGKITPEQVKEFFWRDDLNEARFFGDVLDLSEGT